MRTSAPMTYAAGWELTCHKVITVVLAPSDVFGIKTGFAKIPFVSLGGGAVFLNGGEE
ncbi:hypothetical protein ACFQPB_03055 [Hydrogenophaga atypica]|uniref:Uncharacterized protein n=2 Tax=Hydrogenophaga atypica TaxID=249409 RepID=A0ABW2QFD6_9BURK